MNWLLVFVGGGLGSVARYGINKLINNCFPSLTFPVATFIANIVSCFIFSVAIISFLPKLRQADMMYLLLITGFCGGLSTFSTFSYETFQLMKSGNYAIALINILVSVLSCLLIFWVLIRK